MAIVGAEEIFKKISSQIDSQFPGFIREEGPNFVAFLKAYYEYMEQDGNVVSRTRQFYDIQDIDRTVDDFIEYFRREFMINIPKNVLANKRLLAKHIREFYRSRGSQESYKFLFRAIFDKEIEFYYPGDDILRASDGRWVKEVVLRVAKPFNIDPNYLLGRKIIGETSKAVATVQSILAVEASGITLYDLTIENLTGVFLDGERVTYDLQSGKYVTVNGQIDGLSGLRIVSGGAGHHHGDVLEVGGAQATQTAEALVNEVTDIGAVKIKLVNGGSGYNPQSTRVIVTGGNGTGLEVAIDSYSATAIGTALNNDFIGPMSNVVLNTGPTFVSLGANTSSVSASLAAANVSSTLTSALNFSNNVTYSVNAITLVNPGSGYTTLPTVSIIDDEVSPRNLDDGFGGFLGRNAVVSTNNFPGVIKSVTIRTRGANFNRNEVGYLLNVTQGNSFYTVNATGSFVNGSPTTTYVLQKRTYDGTHTPQPIGLTIYPGKYIDTKGFLSWNNRLQDNYYYQEFSYVIRVSELVDKYRNIIRSLVHPSGTKMFGDYKIGVSIATPISFIEASSNLDSVRVDESVTATDVIVGRSIIPTSISESITTTDTVDGTYSSVNLTSGTESITATDQLPSATYNSVNLTSGTESVTATDSVAGTYNSGILTSGTESITATDASVGGLAATANIVEDNGLIQPYANEDITGEANIQIDEFVAGTLNLDDTQVPGVSSAQSIPIESVISTDSIVGNQTIPSIVTTESVTATDQLPSATYNSVNLTSGTESVTATDSIVGNQTIPAATLDGTGYIDSYASSIIVPYETTTIQDLINVSLTLDDSIGATKT